MKICICGIVVLVNLQVQQGLIETIVFGCVTISPETESSFRRFDSLWATYTHREKDISL
jgi:hypothetical protein